MNWWLWEPWGGGPNPGQEERCWPGGPGPGEKLAVQEVTGWAWGRGQDDEGPSGFWGRPSGTPCSFFWHLCIVPAFLVLTVHRAGVTAGVRGGALT